MSRQQPNIFKKAEKFANITKTMISEGNMARAKKCFLVAEDLLVKGTAETKTAITNICLYSVSQFMEFYGYGRKTCFRQISKKNT